MRCDVRLRNKRIIQSPCQATFACLARVPAARLAFTTSSKLGAAYAMAGLCAHTSSSEARTNQTPNPFYIIIRLHLTPLYRHVQDLQLRPCVPARQVAGRLSGVWRLQLVPARAVEGDVPPVQRQRDMPARVLLFGV